MKEREKMGERDREDEREAQWSRGEPKCTKHLVIIRHVSTCQVKSRNTYLIPIFFVNRSLFEIYTYLFNILFKKRI